MPEHNDGGATVPTSGATKSPVRQGHPVNESGWDKKLRQAREQRMAVLAERNAGKAATKVQQPPETAEKAFTEGEPAETGRDEAFGIRVSGDNALKAFFVFAGAAGFGMGVTLGLGILLGAGAPSMLPDPAAQEEASFEVEEQGVASVFQPEPEIGMADTVNAPVPAAIVALPLSEPVAALPVQPPITEQEAPPEEPVTVGVDDAQPVAEVEVVSVALSEPVPLSETAPDVPVIVGEIVTPDILDTTAIDLPEITAVRYASADVDATTAAMLRSLPDVLQSGYGESADAAALSTGPKYYIHAPTGVSNGRLNGLVAELDEAGLDVAQIGREGFRVSTTHVRYYSADTADAAMAVAENLGVQARDFSKNVVIPQRVEIWIAGRPASSAVVEPAKESPNFFERMRAKREAR